MSTETVCQAIILTFAYYRPGSKLLDDVVALYASDLSDLDPKLVVWAYDAWRKDSSNQHFPLPAEIRKLISPESDPKDDARESAARIITAVRTFGHSNLPGARKFIGELGWEVVRLSGGWFNICSSLDWNERSVYLAQFRDLAESLAKKSKARRAQPTPKAIGPNSVVKNAVVIASFSTGHGAT